MWCSLLCLSCDWSLSTAALKHIVNYWIFMEGYDSDETDAFIKTFIENIS
jgi:hypothetical protein